MVEKLELSCSFDGRTRRIHLYLPNNYAYSEEKYPVLYMMDGQNLFFDWDAAYGKCMGLRDFLDGWWKKLIVVGIECAPDEKQRLEEYSPCETDSKKYGTLEGFGSSFIKWVAEELKPYIDRSYRTWPHREATAIAGCTEGAVEALYGVLSCNDVFSKAAVISPALDPVMDFFRGDIPQRSLSPDTRIFFSWGKEEDAPWNVEKLAFSVLELEKLVQDQGARTYILCQPNGRHNETSWGRQLPVWQKFLWAADN